MRHPSLLDQVGFESPLMHNTRGHLKNPPSRIGDRPLISMSVPRSSEMMGRASSLKRQPRERTESSRLPPDEKKPFISRPTSTRLKNSVYRTGCSKSFQEV